MGSPLDVRTQRASLYGGARRGIAGLLCSGRLATYSGATCRVAATETWMHIVRVDGLRTPHHCHAKVFGAA